MPVAFRVSQVVDMAAHFRSVAQNAPQELRGQFEGWVERTAEAMVEEIPRDSGDTADSMTIEYGDDLTATIGPTNTDDAGRPVGFFINYGTGSQAPDDFIGRTAAATGETLENFDVSAVL